MPQNKPMKIQWITVNGRQVPLVLPQTYSYEIEDWKVTSDRDPLPIVEYGTTAGGIVVPKRVSDEGHELTQLTGSIVEHIIPRRLFTEGLQQITFNAPENARGVYISIRVWGVTGTFNSNEGLNIWSRINTGTTTANMVRLETNGIKSIGRILHAWGVPGDLGDAVNDVAQNIEITPLIPQNSLTLRFEVTGTFQQGEGFDLQGYLLWF